MEYWVVRHIKRCHGVIANRWKKASFTIEAAFLVPWATMLFVIVLSVLFLEHDRVWYTAAACEAVVTANSAYSDEEMRTLAQRKVQERMDAQPFPGADPQAQIQTYEDGCRVGFAGNIMLLNGNMPGNIQVSVDVKRVRPVKNLYRKYTWKKGELLWR